MKSSGRWVGFLGSLLLFTSLVGCGFIGVFITDLTGLPNSITIPASVALTASGGPDNAGPFTWTFSTSCGGTFTSTTTPNNGPANPITIGPTTATTVLVTYESAGAKPGVCTFSVNLSTADAKTASFEVQVRIKSSVNPPTMFTLTLTGTGDGNGVVTATGINCTIASGTTSGDCTQQFISGATVTLTATPDSNSTFAGWSGGADCNDGQVTMTEDMSCTATFNASTQTVLLFNRTDIYVEDLVSYFAITDLNNDGVFDLATSIYDTTDRNGGVAVLLADGLGGLGSPIRNLVPPFGGGGNAPIDFASGDFDNDGNQDLATVYGGIGSGYVMRLLGDGAGHVGSPASFSVGDQPSRVLSADVNNDSELDLIVVSPLSDSLSVLLGDGTGNFGPATNITVGGTPVEVINTDLNNDGNQDLATVNFGDSTVSILLGNGTGAFPSFNTYSVSGARSLVSGDFNKDGKQDIVIVGGAGSVPTFTLLLGNGLGGFPSQSSFTAAGSGLEFVRSADIDNDGNPDLVASGIGAAKIFLGNGMGGFVLAGTFPLPVQTYGLEVGDFNNDNKPDFVIGSAGAPNIHTVFVFINQTP